MAAEAQSDEPGLGGAAGTVSLRERKRTRTRRMLQAEALQLFAEKGYAGTTVEDIADAAAISPRTFFRYFRTKEDVVVWDESDLLTAEFWESRPADEPVAESVRAVFREVMKGLHGQNRDLLLARLRIIFSVPEIRARYWSDQTGAPSAIRSRLVASHISPDDLQVRVVILAIMYAAGVALDRWQRDGGRSDILALFDEAVDALAAAMRELKPARRSAAAG